MRHRPHARPPSYSAAFMATYVLMPWLQLSPADAQAWILSLSAAICDREHHGTMVENSRTSIGVKGFSAVLEHVRAVKT